MNGVLPGTVRAPRFGALLAASAGIHLLIWLAMTAVNSRAVHYLVPAELEIDLGRPIVAAGALPLRSRRAPAPALHMQTDVASELSNETEESAPTADAAPGTALTSPDGVSRGGGEATLGSLDRLPRLRNQADLAHYLRALYPDVERRAKREGAVTLDIHIDGEGTVTAIDTIRADSPAFSDAASAVVHHMSFFPAMRGDHAVPVKVRQTITFRLKD